MKNRIKIFSSLCILPALLCGCIDETVPTNGTTEEVVNSSPKAIEALVWAMPAFMNDYMTVASSHDQFGYGGIMHLRDYLGEDMAYMDNPYMWFSGWAENTDNSESYASVQYIWNYMWKLTQTANNVIRAIKARENPSEEEQAYLSVGYAFRAFAYLDMARMFEFMENDAVSSVNDAGNDVKGLTVPIVDENTTEEEARNNPRVNHEKMFQFILSDLEKAEEHIGDVYLDKTMPDLAVVYGLYARLYMWNENYDKAKEYARKAIDETSCSPLSEEDWVNPRSGFNDLSSNSWMWGVKQMRENDVVQSGIVNWTSFLSNEALYGYAGAGIWVLVDKRFYDRIDDKDFRKLSWIAPEDSELRVKNKFALDQPEFYFYSEYIGNYCSLKFRPGEGNTDEPTTGSCTSYPLMRVEEMYFIEAEAAAQLDAGRGKALLDKFMQTYRFPEYTCAASDQEGVIDEIFFQKRVELWGEGLNYFDYKRLNKGVTRAYPGSNWEDLSQFNTVGRPAWMNFCIVQTEKNNNAALVGYENPTTVGAYDLEQ